MNKLAVADIHADVRVTLAHGVEKHQVAHLKIAARNRIAKLGHIVCARRQLQPK